MANLDSSKASSYCPMFELDSVGIPGTSEFDFPSPVNPQMGRMFDYFEVFDDFIQQTIVETDGPWIENAGTDGEAADAAISAEEEGVLYLVGGDGNGSVAEDSSQVASHIPVQCDSGNLVFETRLKINGAITHTAVNAGFTDTTAREEPFTNASDTITSVATDAACFVYDTGATTETWWACAVDGNTDDAGNASTGIAPTADVFQVLRIEINATGDVLKFFIDGVKVKELIGAGVTPDTDLFPTVIVCSDGDAGTQSIDIDYIYFGHTR